MKKDKSIVPGLKKLKGLHGITFSAGIATGVISACTTAKGLKDFLIQPWQYIMLSTSVQILLFIFSINFFEIYDIIKLAKPTEKKFIPRMVITPLLLILLLCFSSTFSFSYMASYAYSDKIFIPDCERILQNELYKFDIKIKEALEEELKDITNPQNGVFGQILTDLNNYSEVSVHEMGLDDIIESLEIIAEDGSGLEGITASLNRINKGDFTQRDLDNLLTAIDEETKNLKENSEELKKQHEDLTKEVNRIMENMSTFNDTTNPAYQSYQVQLQNASARKNEIGEQITRLTSQTKVLGQVRLAVTNISENGGNLMHGYINTVYQQITKSDFEEDIFLEAVNKIHTVLLEAPKSDSKAQELIVYYSSFLEEAKRYAKLRSALQVIDDQMEDLSERGTYIIKNGFVNVEDEDSMKQWRVAWHGYITNLRTSLQDISTESFNTSTEIDIESRNKILDKLSDMERLYLSDLPLLERSFTILKGDHKYKTIVLFCCFFAFLLDLTSVFSGAVVHYYLEGLKARFKKSNTEN